MRCVRSGSASARPSSSAWPSAFTLQAARAPRCRNAQQEMLECVVAAIAVLMVSYMVLWMRTHSRDLRADLQGAAGSALARGSAGALVAMAFLAVIREGFETAGLPARRVPVRALAGAGRDRRDPRRRGRGRARLPGLPRRHQAQPLPVLPDHRCGAGVGRGRSGDEHPARRLRGRLADGRSADRLDLSAIARPGSVQESLLTGMFGIRSSLPVVEVVAYVLYAVPMLLVVLWPPQPDAVQRGARPHPGRHRRRRPGRCRSAGRARPGRSGSVTGAQGPFVQQGTSSSGTDPATGLRSAAVWSPGPQW